MKARDHPYAPWVQVVLDDFARRGEGRRTFQEAMRACWGHAGRAAWAIYFLRQLGRLEAFLRDDGFGKEYAVVSTVPLDPDAWEATEAPPTHNTVSIERDQDENEKGWAQDCVFVGCDESGREERAWGQSKASVWRCIFRLNEICECGKPHKPRPGEVLE